METKSKCNWTLIPCLGFSLEMVASILMGVDFMVNAFLALIGVLGCLPLGGVAFYFLAYKEPFPTDKDWRWESLPLNELAKFVYLTSTFRFFLATLVGITTTILVFQVSCSSCKFINLWSRSGLRDWENWESWKLVQSLWMVLYIGILVILSAFQFIANAYQNQKVKNDPHPVPQLELEFEFPVPNPYSNRDSGFPLPCAIESEAIRIIINFLQLLILYNGYKLWVVSSYVTQLKGRYQEIGISSANARDVGVEDEITRKNDLMESFRVYMSKIKDGGEVPFRIAIYQTIVNTLIAVLYGSVMIKMICWDLVAYQSLPSRLPSSYVIGTILPLNSIYDASGALIFSAGWTVFSFICGIIFLHASVALWKGVVTRDAVNCGFWFKSQAAYIILLGLQLAYGMIFGSFEWLLMIILIVNGWMFRTVHGFMKRISNPELVTAVAPPNAGPKHK